jgi:hypothetical protein
MTAFIRRSRNTHKFGAKKTEYDGIKFDSKLEANYYLHLKRLQQIGDVIFFLRQTPFHLPGNVTYRVDFQIFWSNGHITFDDVKGMETKEFIRAKKQVEDIYPVVINVVKKSDF